MPAWQYFYRQKRKLAVEVNLVSPSNSCVKAHTERFVIFLMTTSSATITECHCSRSVRFMQFRNASFHLANFHGSLNSLLWRTQRLNRQHSDKAGHFLLHHWSHKHRMKIRNHLHCCSFFLPSKSWRHSHCRLQTPISRLLSPACPHMSWAHPIVKIFGVPSMCSVILSWPLGVRIHSSLIWVPWQYNWGVLSTKSVRRASCQTQYPDSVW